ncbi:hypothetical protein HY490_03640 [Candidatus Woesearchaeota archaeon]|nr:hypothetical protein [Candidatus Woesearchaeota archaeon]
MLLSTYAGQNMNRDHYRRKTPEDFPDKTSVAGSEFEKVRGLRYGWNPGDPAAWYREVGATGPCAGTAKIVQENPNKPIGYINMEDVDAGLRLVHKLYSVFGHVEYVAAVFWCRRGMTQRLLRPTSFQSYPRVRLLMVSGAFLIELHVSLSAKSP